MGSEFFGFENLKQFKNNEFIVYRIAQNEERIYHYNQIVSLSQKLSNVFRNGGLCGARISLQCPHSAELCVILLSILNCGSSFCGIPCNADANDVCDATKEYQSTFLVSHISWEQIDFMKILEKCIILDKTVYIFEVLNSTCDHLREKVSNECYSIKTSGSTGMSKIVHVPVPSILPNIKSQSTLLRLSPKDLILFSSPITFDPFVVEFFLALWSGCALLIVESALKFTPHIYAAVLTCGRRGGATVAQMTPSLFRLFGLETIKESLLASSTSLRILLLGGEQFPSVQEISTWTVNNKWQTRIFNIYGITEVSCWSTIYELKRGVIEDCIPLGSPIDNETEIRIINDSNEAIVSGTGYIEIGSSNRKCVIGGECPNEIFSTGTLFRATNDIASIIDGKIFYEGRKNDTVKRYGNRVNLNHITKTLISIDGVVDACCVFNNLKMQLIYFIVKNKHNSKEEIKSKIMRNLSNFEKPDGIKFVNYFPVTSHGKISKKDLLLSFENRAKTPFKCFVSFIRNVLGIKICYASEGTSKKKKKFSLNLSFLDAGGTSFQALTLATEIEQLLKRPEPLFLKMLLDGKTSLATISDLISSLPYDNTTNLPSMYTLNSNRNDILKVIWKYDTGKCVDSTPNCYDNVVSVGSHSCLLITLDSETGQTISLCILSDRIECQVCYFDRHLLLVGCYDGVLYVVNYIRGEIMWQLDCEGMIKSRPLRKTDLIVVGNYSSDGNLICLNINKKSVEWKLQIGSKGVFSSPVEVSCDSFVACTLSGEVACIMFSNGNIIWEKKFQSPIFSTPALFSHRAVIVAEVAGIVHCLHTTSGAELWTFKSDGNIFSGILVHKENDHDYQIIFGCHDHRIYCLQSKTENQSPSIMWKNQCNSAIYSTPAIIYLSNDKPAVVSCSTQGIIYILDYFSGLVIFTLSLNGEIFSSPFVSGKKIYVGCRDNNLLCLEIQSDK